MSLVRASTSHYQESCLTAIKAQPAPEKQISLSRTTQLISSNCYGLNSTMMDLTLLLWAKQNGRLT